MDVQAYLERIDISQMTPNYLFLEKLMNAHLRTIPFENLNVMAKKTLKLDQDALFEKIVGQSRGGFCYELNGLFSTLLHALGFEVNIGAAYVFDDKKQKYSYVEDVYDHMVLFVQLERLYLVDVGFGDSVRTPISLPNGQVEDVSGQYRVVPTNPAKNAYELQQKQYKGTWMPLYQFNLNYLTVNDFKYSCRWTETSPESHFTQRAVTTIATKTGRITLTDHILTITTDKKKEKTTINNNETRKQMLKKHFGIILP